MQGMKANISLFIYQINFLPTSISKIQHCQNSCRLPARNSVKKSGQTEKNSRNRTAGTKQREQGKARQGNKSRTIRTTQPEQDSQGRKARIGLPGQDSQYRAARTGQPGPCQDKADRTGYDNNQGGTTRIRQP
jgi:hypothetical protein